MKASYIGCIRSTGSEVLRGIGVHTGAFNRHSTRKLQRISIVLPCASQCSTKYNPPDAKSFKSVVRLLNKNLVDLQTEEWNSHLESLSVQCKLLDVTDLEKKSNVWSRIIFSMPAGQLSFLLRAGTDCLPTPMNLSRWKIHVDPSCCLCLSKLCTTNHILNCCPEALSQNRYTWRHDSVLLCLIEFLKSNLDHDHTIYADLPGLRALDNPPLTIPPSVIPTSARPDIFIKNNSEIHILELTIPMNTSNGLKAARSRKQSKQIYISLVNDLITKGYSVNYDTIEIGSLGHFERDSISALHSILPNLSIKSISHSMLLLSKIAIMCSRHIFLSRLQHSCFPHHYYLCKFLFYLYVINVIYAVLLFYFILLARPP